MAICRTETTTEFVAGLTVVRTDSVSLFTARCVHVCAHYLLPRDFNVTLNRMFLPFLIREVPGSNLGYPSRFMW